MFQCRLVTQLCFQFGFDSLVFESLPSLSVFLRSQVNLFYNIPTPAPITKTLSVESKLLGDCLVSTSQNLMMNFTVK